MWSKAEERELLELEKREEEQRQKEQQETEQLAKERQAAHNAEGQNFYQSSVNFAPCYHV